MPPRNDAPAPASPAPEPHGAEAPPSHGVSATAHLDKEIYGIGEAIQLTVALHNDLPQPIALVHPDYWGVSEIHVFDAAGQRVEPTSTYKAHRKAVQETWTIDGGSLASHTFEDMTTFTCCNAYTYRSLPAGSYSVAVEITNPPTRTDPPEGWSGGWEGRVTSPRVAFRVGR
ncbi:MAG: hypothetical protein KC420_10835 [Myxococcales bacterium]|nr:hypothetical protein [Myxococcales bacterium]MCB9706660.1 hypothetical protein [Myxococcales bacterium]